MFYELFNQDPLKFEDIVTMKMCILETREGSMHACLTQAGDEPQKLICAAFDNCGPIKTFTMYKFDYNKNWRAWILAPSDDDRLAAKWE